jgi:trigger factor
MKIALDVLSPLQRRIRVELPAEAVKEEYSRVYGDLGQRARVPGFRPGKVPRTVLQGLYGDEIKGRVLARLLDRSLKEAFEEKGLEVVSRPQVESADLEEGRPFSFSALVEIKPEIPLKSYLGLEVERIKLEVTEEHVDGALKQLQESHAQLETVEGRDVVALGDCVVLDFTGSVGGKPLPGAKAENYFLEVGAGKALPQFEEGVVGLKKGREHNMRVTYPDDFPNRGLAAQAVDFRVTVREIQRKVLAPLDDDFAKDYGGCGSLEELRRKIRERIAGEWEGVQRREMKEQVLAKLLEGYDFDLPRALVEQQLRQLREQHEHQGEPHDEGPAGSGSIPPEALKAMESQAQRRVRALLVVEKIAEQENISVADADLNRRIEQRVHAAGQKGPVLREFYERRDAREDLRWQMTFDRTLDLLLQHAQVKEKEWDPAHAEVDASRKKS